MSSYKEIRAGFAVAAVGAMLLAGCGGDDGGSADSTSAEETQPLASFIKQADQICAESARDTEDDVRKAVQAAQSGDDDALTQVVADVTIPALREQFNQIAALPPPEGAEDQVDEILAAADQALAVGDDNPDSFIVGPDRASPFDPVAKLERELGLKVCGAS